MKDTRIFKASEVKTGEDGYIADLSPADCVNPDFYWRFDTRKQARFFLHMVDGGIEGKMAQFITMNTVN